VLVEQPDLGADTGGAQGLLDDLVAGAHTGESAALRRLPLHSPIGRA
jgi:hypothetical protein